MNVKRFVLLLAVALLIGAGVAPLFAMLAASLTVEGAVSFAHYQALLTSGRMWALLGRSLLVAALTAFFATALGVPLGVLFGRTDLPLRRLFAFLFTVPLLLPPYFLALAWFSLLGRDGWLARLTDSATAEVTSNLLFGLPGCVLVLATVFLPVVMLLTMTFLRTVNPHLEEAGRLGAPWSRVLRGITLPMALPGVLLGVVLTFLLALGEFTVPMFLRYSVFPVQILIQFSAFYDFGAATALAFPLALITLVVLAGERLWKGVPAELHPAGKPLRIRLGSSRKGWIAFVGFLCLGLVALPLAALGLQTSIAAFGEAFTRAGDALGRSLSYAALGATLLTLLGFFLGYLLHTEAFRIARAVDFFSLFLLVLPSSVLGIGLIGLWNRPGTQWLYASPAILLTGYLAQYAALTSRITTAALGRIPPSMEEAAAIAGAGWPRRMAFIVTPLIGQGLLVAWLTGYIFCLRDTGIAMLVYPPGGDTFPVRLFTLMANSPFELISALCLLMIVATLVPLGALAFLWRRRAP
ncbi:MAG: ABC transporter permease subunit [Pseudomonadota bacterium]